MLAIEDLKPTLEILFLARLEQKLEGYVGAHFLLPVVGRKRLTIDTITDLSEEREVIYAADDLSHNTERAVSVRLGEPTHFDTVHLFGRPYRMTTPITVRSQFANYKIVMRYAILELADEYPTALGLQGDGIDFINLASPKELRAIAFNLFRVVGVPVEYSKDAQREPLMAFRQDIHQLVAEYRMKHTNIKLHWKEAFDLSDPLTLDWFHSEGIRFHKTLNSKALDEYVTRPDKALYCVLDINDVEYLVFFRDPTSFSELKHALARYRSKVVNDLDRYVRHYAIK